MKTLMLFGAGCFLGKINGWVAKKEIKRISQAPASTTKKVFEQHSLNVWICGMMIIFLNNRFAFSSSHFYFACLLISWLDILSVMDSSAMFFSNRVFYGLGLPLCGYSLFVVSLPVVLRLASVISVWLLLKGMMWFVWCWKKSAGMGEGDVALLMMLAFIYGSPSIYLTILLSAVLGLFSRQQERFPFVPFISAAALVVFYLYVPLF